MEEKVYINGSLVPKSEARISVYDRLFLYGDGFFESIIVHNRIPFKLNDHIDRLVNSARCLKIEMTLTRNELRGAIDRTIRENDLTNGAIRVQVSRGEGMGVDKAGTINNPNVVIFAEPFSEMLPEKVSKKASQGLTAVVVSTRRTPPECLDPRIKSGNYLNLILASLERAAAGADAAIMLDTRGFVSEGPGYNIFIVKDGTLHTSASHSCLEGVTRNTIIRIALEVGQKVVEGDLTTYDLYTADEVFICGSARGIMPIINIDGREVDMGRPGPITRHIQELYEKYVEKETYRD